MNTTHPSNEELAAARHILDQARDGVPVSYDKITFALMVCGDLRWPGERWMVKQKKPDVYGLAVSTN